MNPVKRILLFFVLPFIAPMLFPPATLRGASIGIGIAALLFIMMGFLLWRGRSLALTFSIFLQGMNVIIRPDDDIPSRQDNHRSDRHGLHPYQYSKHCAFVLSGNETGPGGCALANGHLKTQNLRRALPGVNS